MDAHHHRLLGVGALAALLVAAPLCEVVEAALSPLTTSTTVADLLAVRAHETQFVVSVVVGLLGTMLLLPAVLGLAAVTAQRAPWASRVAAACLTFALMGFAGMRLGQGIELQGVRDGLPLEQVAGLLDHQDSNPIGAPMVIVFLLGTAIGMVALGLAVWRAGLSRFAAVLIAAFPFADQGLESLGTLAGVAAHALLLLGLGWVAVTLVRRRAPVRVPVAAPAVATA